jgi:hypothetical protein
MQEKTRPRSLLDADDALGAVREGDESFDRVVTRQHVRHQTIFYRRRFDNAAFVSLGRRRT